MAIPRVFVGSTCYDLKYIRNNLQYFINSLGYLPVLSEAGDVFYDPAKHTHDSCTSEVGTCQLFVLIIGGRFGGAYKDSDKSITNGEYEEAVKCRIPVFTLIEQSVYAEHHVYSKNKTNNKVNAKNINYPAVDNTKIFDFIDDVRKASFNNAIQPFQDFSDIESYLKKQWAGLMFSFLSRRSEEARVMDVVSHLSRVNEKVEFISQQILNVVGTNETKILAPLYDIMLGHHRTTEMLLGTGHKLTPFDILKHKELLSCAQATGRELVVSEDKDFSYSSIGEVSKVSLLGFVKEYEKMRNEMLETITNAKLNVDQVLKSQSAKQ